MICDIFFIFLRVPGVEVLENLAYLANASNLVMYLSEYMQFSPSNSANSVTNFMGTSFLLALLGGFLSDAFFTTYQIYLISAVIEFLVNLFQSISKLSFSLFSLFMITTFWSPTPLLLSYPKSWGSSSIGLVLWSVFFI